MQFVVTTILCSCGRSLAACEGFLRRRRKILRCLCGYDYGVEVRNIDRKTVTIKPCNPNVKTR